MITWTLAGGRCPWSHTRSRVRGGDLLRTLGCGNGYRFLRSPPVEATAAASPLQIAWRPPAQHPERPVERVYASLSALSRFRVVHPAQSGRARSRAKNLRGARFAPWTGPGRVSRLAVELWQSPASTRRRYWNDDERCSSPSPASSGVASLRASSAAPVYRAARSWSVVAIISWRRVIRRSSSISE